MNLLKVTYSGDIIDTTLNYGYWINWLYNATIGFPLYFITDYSKRFMYNLLNRRRALNVEKDERLLPRQNIFRRSLAAVWMDIRRRWRNLAIKSFGGAMYRRWYRNYRRISYQARLKRFFSHKRSQ